MDKRMPKVTIFMSCYNHEKYVGEAIDSIIGQTYENWELYVVNDGSTDRSGEIIASYKDERIHYFDFKVNTQFVGAFNFLMDVCGKSDSDYIAGLSSDDKWEKDKLEKQLEVMLAHPEYKACFTWDKVIFSAENRGMYANATTYSHWKNRNRYEWVNIFFVNGNCLNACSMLADKSVFYELGTMNQYYRQLSDFRLWYFLVRKYPFFLMEEELTYYRRHETNISEATPEVRIRDSNEGYKITKEVFLSMDKETLRRSLYRHLPYMICDTEEELIAEKFILLLRYPSYVYEQIAIEFYFDHCNNKRFISIMEDKYSFGTQDFLNLSGKAGMLTCGNPSIREGHKVLTPALVLLNAIDSGKLREDSLDQYRYSTMFDLWNLTNTYEGGRQQFERIRKLVMDLQDKRRGQEKHKVLFLIAQSCKWDFSPVIQERMKEGAECYIAFVPSWEEAMKGDYNDLPDRKVEGVEMLSLYDRTEHSLYFSFELSKEVDSIYYVDCIDEEYECYNMASGYSLAVDYHCMINNETYWTLSQNDDSILAMMRDIEIYDGGD